MCIIVFEVVIMVLFVNLKMYVCLWFLAIVIPILSFFLKKKIVILILQAGTRTMQDKV